MKNIEKLLKIVVERDASDLHLKVGNKPILRKDTELIPLDLHVLTDDDLNILVRELLSTYQMDRFREQFAVDLAYPFRDLSRFRINVYKERGNSSIAIRRIKSKIPSLNELSLPPALEKIALENRGLIFITGPTGSGKSTTLAAMIEKINMERGVHIVTVEDPIEYVYEDKKSIISQREIGIDAISFKAALREVLRQDPDVILIGEMRDEESFMAAVSAAETGHLVMTTLHTNSTTKSIHRILEFFPPEMHEQVRYQIGHNLNAVISQKLLPKADGSGVIPCLEILMGSGLVRKLVMENRIGELGSAMENGADFGMQTFNIALTDLTRKGLITQEVALANSPNPHALKMRFKGIDHPEAKRILNIH